MYVELTPKPLIPWIGGKRRLTKHLLPLSDHRCYVEPFCGAAALYFAKEPSKVEVLNDINRDLATLYRVVTHHFEELYKQFKWVLISRENWDKLQATPPETLTDIQRAARFLYLQKMAFGGKVSAQSFGTATQSAPKFNLMTLETDLLAAHQRLQRTYIENQPWQQVMQRYDRPHTMFYCDPPYWQTEGYGVDFGWDQYVQLRDFAKDCKGKVIISINDHHDIVDLFADFHLEVVNHTYTVAGGGKASKVKELIYRNWR